jgi:demethoxyubiquinone hydroxylase (CLK1/Coq7/Cat5 family)
MPADACTVYFDGACPLCRREIAHYRRAAGEAGIDWVDASACPPSALGGDLPRQAALSRLHVRLADGSLVAGAAAFAAIWARLPGYSWLAALAARRPVMAAMEIAYAAFLRLRPLWRRAEPAAAVLPREVLGDLRTDHLAEAGAVQIHRGILALTDDADLRAFAARRLAIEHLHLRRVRRWLPSGERSWLLPLWRAAGWLTGAVAALIGPRAVLATVSAAERFVDRRYAAQIERLSAHPELSELRAALAACRSDEFARLDARQCLRARSRLLGRGRAAVVGKGSELAGATGRGLS